MKKISPNLIGLIIALVVSFGSLFLYQYKLAKKSYQLIDNPTEAALGVSIDGTKYSIAPKQFVEVELGKGVHQIAITSGPDSLLRPPMNFEVTKRRGVINPTLSRYFIYSMPYGPNVNHDSIFMANQTDFQGKIYYGPLKIDSAVYMDSFYYNLNEKFPSVTLKSENKQLRNKIFREGEFKQFYFEHYE